MGINNEDDIMRIFKDLRNGDLLRKEIRVELRKKKNRDYANKRYRDNDELRLRKTASTKRWREKESNGEYIKKRKYKLPTQEEWDEILAWHAKKGRVFKYRAF